MLHQMIVSIFSNKVAAELLLNLSKLITSIGFSTLNFKNYV